MKWFGNLTGAFSDGAVLFPLLAVLSLQSGMDGMRMMASAGAVYIAAGLVFRVPMAVQPLKSLAVTALALGATTTEIALGGFTVGFVCLMLSLFYVDSLAKKVPRHLVHGLQMALGLMLMIKGGQLGLNIPEISLRGGFIILTIIILGFTWWTKKPVIGWIATAGLIIGVLNSAAAENIIPASVPVDSIRPNLILALVLPQLALTLTNSVIGAHDVAQHYFGTKAYRVTPKWLLRSIGIGNIILAPLGGLPFCHGAGGITAHVKGGACNWHMNLIIGGTLLGLALISWQFGRPIIPAFPQNLMAALLFATGFFHVDLVRSSWQKKDLRWLLIGMAFVTVVTQNMLYVLGIGILSEILRCFLITKKMKRVEQ